MAIKTVKSVIDDLTREGELVASLSGGDLICTACGHRCKLHPGQRGVCKVRYNSDGVLKVPSGYSAGIHNDPIEKKPFFHAYPGTTALSFGMLGCDFRCDYCQNWLTSQALRDAASTQRHERVSAREIVGYALQCGSRAVVSTYNEPLITSEWAVEVFREARRHGLATGFVSNGHGTPEALDYLRPWLDLFKIDLKCFDAKKYRKLGGDFGAVCDTIRGAFVMGAWVEIVTLVIPDYNDTDAELSAIAKFIASVSVDIPWHVTAFHPDYKMQDRGRTPPQTLIKARRHGLDAGLRYVYSGNLPGRVGDTESTFCPRCGKRLIHRVGFAVTENQMRDGACDSCGERIPGRWN